MKPWERPEWIAEVTRWIDRRLVAAGCGRAHRVEIRRVTAASAIVCAETASTSWILKAGLPMSRREPRITRWLSREFGESVPRVIAIDQRRGWLLMQEVSGEPLFLASAPEPWCRAVEAFAHLQTACVSRTDELIALGGPDRSATRLARDIEERLMPLVRRGGPAVEPLSPAERAAIVEIAPRWQQMCRAPALAVLPAVTLDHGDLHPQNVLRTERRAVFVDWASASLSHPFFSPITLIGYGLELWPELGGAYDQLREAYLRPWLAWASLDALIGAFEYARPLAALNYAVSILHAPRHAQPQTPGVAARPSTVALCLRVALLWTAGHPTSAVALSRMHMTRPAPPLSREEEHGHVGR